MELHNQPQKTVKSVAVINACVLSLEFSLKTAVFRSLQVVADRRGNLQNCIIFRERCRLVNKVTVLDHNPLFARDWRVSTSHTVRNVLGGLPEKTHQRLNQCNAACVPNHGLGLERLILHGAELKMS
jgi:hypothetical protein